MRELAALAALACVFAAIPFVGNGKGASALDPFTGADVCRATIAAVMGRPVEIVRVDGTKDGIIMLSYVRPDDRSLWRYRCRIERDEVVWATETGRWRTDPDDEKVRFIVHPTARILEIEQRFSPSSATRDKYTIEDLRRR